MKIQGLPLAASRKLKRVSASRLRANLEAEETKFHLYELTICLCVRHTVDHTVGIFGNEQRTIL